MSTRDAKGNGRRSLLLLLSLAACGDDDQPGNPTLAADEAGIDIATLADASAVIDASASALEPPHDAASSATYDGGASVVGTEVGSSMSDAQVNVVGAEGYLLVAELAPEREAIHAFRLPDLRPAGRVDGVLLGNHLGAIALPDGRVVVSDDKHGEIIALRIEQLGLQVVNRVDAELGEGGVWGCADEQLRYLAIASGREQGEAQVANVVDLASFNLTPLEVAMNVIDGATEELHTAIAGTPLHLFASVGGEIRAYRLDDVLAKRATAPVASVMIQTGSHGPIVSHGRGLFYVAAAPGTGFDGVRTSPPFERAQLIPWDVQGRTTGRNARPRLSFDGKFIFGAIGRTEPAAPEQWASRDVDLQAVDLATLTPSRNPLTTGLVSKFQLSRRYALFANVTGTGDYAILVDVEPDSPTFRQVVARIELPRLADGPLPGTPTAGKETRGSAITPDGNWAFVSHGGEGKISVIDSSKKAVVGEIQVPTPLTGGGYLFAVQPGAPNMDTCMR